MIKQLDTIVKTQSSSQLSKDIIQKEIQNEQDQILITPIFRLRNRQSFHEIPTIRGSSVPMNNFEIIMKNNEFWADINIQKDPDFFKRHQQVQKPEFLWIGCCDSRVPANDILGLKPGQLFVHRNIGNQAPLSDVNVSAVIQYSIQSFQINDIIVCGHTGCLGIKAAFQKQIEGPLENWISLIREIRARYRKNFDKDSKQQNELQLVRLNVIHQVLNIARFPVVQKKWKQNKQVRIHGMIYNVETGLLQNLKTTIDSLQDLPNQYRIY